jgi:DNA mismatch endonuclease (patch repair protein)
MADVFSEEKRSEVMSKIRSKETQAERLAFSYLRKQGIYFQKHYKRAVGNPDIALPKKKRAVFIDGEFWHGRTYEKVLKNRPAGDYWITKIKNNMDRDKINRQKLLADGWEVMSVWDSDIKRIRTRATTLEEIARFLIQGIEV